MGAERLYWCGSAENWDIVRDGAGVERPDRQGRLFVRWSPQYDWGFRDGKEPGTRHRFAPAADHGTPIGMLRVWRSVEGRFNGDRAGASIDDDPGLRLQAPKSR
jgi:hypothetical protein